MLCIYNIIPVQDAIHEEQAVKLLEQQCSRPAGGNARCILVSLVTQESKEYDLFEKMMLFTNTLC